MHNVHRVDLLDSGDDLVKEKTSLMLLHSTIGYNVVKELATRSVLHDQVQLPSRLYDLVELNDVRMPNQLEDMNLSRNAFYISHLYDTFFLQDLHSHALASEDVSA